MDWLLLSGVILCILPGSTCNSLACNCTDAVCPKANSPCAYGRITDLCGCCTVCIRKLNDVCGGQNDIFGRCETDLRCVYGGLDLKSKLMVGFCENSNGKLFSSKAAISYD